MQINIFSIVNVRFPYYDSYSRGIKFKKRPALVISRENDSQNADLTVFPVSSVTLKVNLNLKYDIEVKKSVYPNLNLDRDVSYIRVHKPHTVNSKECIDIICDDIRIYYEDLAIFILKTFEDFSKTIIDSGLDM